ARPVSSMSSAERRADIDSVPLESDHARRLRWEALKFAILAFLVYLANGRVLTHGDSLATRYLPFATWKDGSLRLDTVADVATRILPDQWGPDPHWIAKGPDGHLYSRYPVTQPVILTPFYAPAAGYLAWRGWDPGRIERLGVLHEKVLAAAVAAAAAGLMYAPARRRLARGRAALLRVGFAFGTATWSISSQALWQHGLAEMLLALALLLVPSSSAAGQGRRREVVATGLACGLLIANRPPDVLLAAPLLVLLFGRAGSI